MPITPRREIEIEEDLAKIEAERSTARSNSCHLAWINAANDLFS
jgi:hypothetical protein